ncbi:MAG TPA: hypothetical protein VKE22_19295 [Haliangiales bacterium]|nr:hypothetical protein [Haliangiales bacterium]
MTGRVFLLSPARLDGERARMLTRPGAGFPLAHSLRQGGVPLADVMTFLSALYFRGKQAYARAFGRPPRTVASAGLIVTSNRGLWPMERPVTARDLAALAEGDIDSADDGYRAPLERDLAALAGASTEIVLLGSIASHKYVTPMTRVLGERLLFPPDFVGRGDMSRGGLLLRCVEARAELSYAPVLGAPRHGKRPERLPPKPRRAG